jgi:hypothetical protein
MLLGNSTRICFMDMSDLIVTFVSALVMAVLFYFIYKYHKNIFQKQCQKLLKIR